LVTGFPMPPETPVRSMTFPSSGCITLNSLLRKFSLVNH
jgi:hypothetical protein